MAPSRETQLQSSKAIQQPEAHSSKNLSTDPLMIPITHLYHHNIPTVQKIRHIKHSCVQKFENEEIYCKKKCEKTFDVLCRSRSFIITSNKTVQ